MRPISRCSNGWNVKLTTHMYLILSLRLPVVKLHSPTHVHVAVQTSSIILQNDFSHHHLVSRLRMNWTILHLWLQMIRGGCSACRCGVSRDSYSFAIMYIKFSADSGNRQGRIKLFGAPRQWKYFRPLFQAVFLSGGVYYPPRLSQTPRLPVPRQK